MDKTEQSPQELFEHQTFSMQTFEKEDCFHLWQYFSDRADMLKDRLWTTGTWLLGFNSAILGFIFGTELVTFDTAGFVIQSPSVVLILSLAGCVLCLYSLVLINDYGLHIQRNWDRAEVLEKKLPLVTEALKGKARTKDQQKSEVDGHTSTDGESEKTLADNSNTEAEAEGNEKEEQQKSVPKLQDRLLHKVKQIAGLPPIAKNLIVFTLLYYVAFLTVAALACQRLIVSP